MPRLLSQVVVSFGDRDRRAVARRVRPQSLLRRSLEALLHHLAPRLTLREVNGRVPRRVLSEGGLRALGGEVAHNVVLAAARDGGVERRVPLLVGEQCVLRVLLVNLRKRAETLLAPRRQLRRRRHRLLVDLELAGDGSASALVHPKLLDLHPLLLLLRAPLLRAPRRLDGVLLLRAPGTTLSARWPPGVRCSASLPPRSTTTPPLRSMSSCCSWVRAAARPPVGDLHALPEGGERVGVELRPGRAPSQLLLSHVQRALLVAVGGGGGGGGGKRRSRGRQRSTPRSHRRRSRRPCSA